MLKSKSSATATVAHADGRLTSGVYEDFGQDCQYPTQPPSVQSLQWVHLPPTPVLTTASNCPPPKKKFHLINNICFQGSSPLLLFHLCLGYHSNYSLSSVIPSLYISAPSHDWLPASTLIIAGGNAQKVVASCFLLQATQLLSCFTFPPAT